jgi:hypothetical protein
MNWVYRSWTSVWDGGAGRIEVVVVELSVEGRVGSAFAVGPLDEIGDEEHLPSSGCGSVNPSFRIESFVSLP